MRIMRARIASTFSDGVVGAKTLHHPLKALALLWNTVTLTMSHMRLNSLRRQWRPWWRRRRPAEEAAAAAIGEDQRSQRWWRPPWRQWRPATTSGDQQRQRRQRTPRLLEVVATLAAVVATIGELNLTVMIIFQNVY